MREARHTVTSVTPVADSADDSELARLKAAAIDGWYGIVAGRGWEAVEIPDAVLHRASGDAHGAPETLRSWQVSGWVGSLAEGKSRITFDDPDDGITLDDSLQGGLTNTPAPVERRFPGRGEEHRGYRHALQELLDRVGARSHRGTALAAIGSAGPLPASGTEAATGGVSTGGSSTRDVRVVRERLQAAATGAHSGAADLDLLCAACVDLLSVDGAAVAATVEGSLGQSFGASSELSRELGELQFTFGEGPCLDVLREGAPVGVSLQGPAAKRWPAFTSAALGRGVRTVLALPVSVAQVPVGSLALYCFDDRELDNELVAGALIAAELAALPLFELTTGDVEEAPDVPPGPAPNVGSLSRVEVYQAVGMLIVQLGVGPDEALARLRAYAFSHDLTASAVGWEIVQRRLRLDDDRCDQP